MSVSRRNFVQAVGAGATGAALGATSTTGEDAALRRVFDALLHCPAETGELWQWHTVTRNFDEFVAYLDRTGVERGIINSQRSQEKGTPAEFVAGNREKEYDHIFKRIDLVAQHPNCYMDTSGYGHDRMGMLEYAVKTIGSDRVLFGSDFSINDPSTVLARIHHSFLTEEQKRKVLAGNLEELLARFPV